MVSAEEAVDSIFTALVRPFFLVLGPAEVEMNSTEGAFRLLSMNSVHFSSFIAVEVAAPFVV